MCINVFWSIFLVHTNGPDRQRLVGGGQGDVYASVIYIEITFAYKTHICLRIDIALKIGEILNLSINAMPQTNIGFR